MNKKVFFWNMLGSGIYSLASILFVLIAKRLVGEAAGAQFYMAFTTGQMLLTIGYFEIRPYQVTDVLKKYKPEEYFGFRIITCTLMFVASICVGMFYLSQGKADRAGFGLIVTMCILKMFDGFADVFEGEFQRNERMDISGKSLTFRTVAILIMFIIIAYVTKDIYTASMSAAAIGLVGVIAVMIVWHKSFAPLGVSLSLRKMKRLFDNTVLLFLGSAMCMWIWNGTKYVVEWNLSTKETLIYGIVYMPTMVINLCSGFVFKPMLTTLAINYEKRDKKAFMKIILMLSGWVLLMTVATLIGGAWLGVPVLSWLYEVELEAYRNVMMILIIAGGFNAFSIIFYYALTVMRKQVQIFIGYIVTFAMSIILPVILVNKKGLMGAGVSYLLVMLLLTGIFSVMTVYDVKKIKSKGWS